MRPFCRELADLFRDKSDVSGYYYYYYYYYSITYRGIGDATRCSRCESRYGVYEGYELEVS